MLTVAFMAASCAKDDLGVPTNSEGHPVRVTLNIGMGKSTDIVVTRADNSYSDLGNLYLFVYGSDGKYQQMLSTTATDPNNSITVETRSENDNGVTYTITINTTSGTKNLLAVANTSAVADEGGFWSSMASIATDAAAGDLSFKELKAAVISLREDLYENTQMLPIQIVSSTQMLISGVNEGVVFDTNGNITNYGPDEVVVKMDRAMARITFNIAQTVEGAKGTFVPSSYRVYNIPTESVLTNTNKSNTKSDNTYINSAPMTIGNVSGGNYTFSFYMPENIPEANRNASIATYQDRDKWSGDKGSRPENKEWTNAPQNSTFVVISGTYSQSGDTTDTTDKNSYTGNVSYTIHLGDFSNKAWSNFNVERNYSYTYKMSVKGVDSIVVEAEKDGDEKQPGAEGQIFTYDASTYSYELDAHYEQVFLEYNLSTIAENITTALRTEANPSDEAIDNAIADNLILVIQSEAMDYTHAATDAEPYTVQNKRGTFSPYRIYANAVRNAADPAAAATAAKENVLAGEGENISPTKGFDYKWVEFWPQTGTDIAAYPGVSEWSREDLRGFSNEGAYGGDTTTYSGYLKDVYDVIVAMGKVVKKIYKGEDVSLDDRNDDGIIVTQSNNGYVARFTAFVNEYYYYRHPLTGMKVTSWSVMTNKIPREMIIAMSSSISQDGNSSYSQIYSYITQASIQTFYNSRVSDINGFGIETYNETPHITFGKEGLNGLSKTDGRSNQITLIGGLPQNWDAFIASSYNGWTKSVGSDRTTHKLSEAAYKTSSGGSGAYYACLSRNRDLNGNGVIDNNEIRWYLPSLNEYIRIGVGSNAISNAAQLYMGDKMNMKRPTTPGSYADGYPIDYIWDGALYYTSSSDAERVYWAVERGSSSADGQNWGGGFAAKPIRCIRSLPANAGGSDVSTVHVASDASYVAHNVPGTYGYVRTEPTVLEFKGRLVDELYRERTDGVLGPHNEDDKANSFYDGVFVAKEEVYRMESTGGWRPTKVYIKFPLKQIINYEGNQINPCASYSEDGDGGAVWRVPNLAEFSAMVATGLVKSDDACCTQFSNMNVRFGFVYGSYVYCPGNYVQDGNSYKTPTINTVGSFKVRCVRDVPEGYVFPQ